MISQEKESIWNRLKNRVRLKIDAALDHTRNHYLSCFPKNPGLLTRSILRLFYTGVRMDPAQVSVVSNLPQKALLIYACKYHSRFEYLFYHNRYPDMQLPCPEITFDSRTLYLQPIARILKILLARFDAFSRRQPFPDPFLSGYYEACLLNGTAGFVTLLEKGGFYRRFVKQKNDPMRYLIDLQKKQDRPVFIIPQLMFFSRTPHRHVRSFWDVLFGTEENPGKLRRMITLFKNPGKVFVEVSEPVNLRAFLSQPELAAENSESQAVLLRRQLTEQVNRHRRSITGPTLKSREEIKEDILTSNRLNDYLIHYAHMRNMPLYRVRKEASEFLDEIAANYNVSFIKFGAVCVKWMVESMFDGLSVEDAAMNQIKAISKKGPVIFVPCHKSHIDYLVLPYVLYTNHMPAPHVVAGNNLSFWPMGPIFRMGGAFFIRRTFRGAILYARVFSEYVHKLLQEGFNIKIFIEGGRSRTGKLIMPKLGFLSILLNAYKNGACEEMSFVPIFIGYDRVLEENAYLNEIEGGQKESENIIQVLKARKFLRKRWGRIYIKLGDPISAKSLVSESAGNPSDLSSKTVNQLVRDLGYRLTNAIDSVTVVTPHALAASAILNIQQSSFTRRQLQFYIDTYLTYLNFQQMAFADSLLLDAQAAIDTALENYIQRKFIEPVSSKTEISNPENAYQIREYQRPNLEYYKNNNIACFVPAAFTALCILKMDAFQFAASDLHPCYAQLQEFFKFEFAFNVERPPEYLVRKTLKAFIDDAILMPHPTLPDTYNLTSSGFRKLKIFSGFLKTFFEAYSVVLDYFEKAPAGNPTQKERLRKIQSLGNRMHKFKRIERKESLSKIYFQNALEFFLSQGIKSREDTEKIAYYTEMIHDFQAYL